MAKINRDWPEGAPGAGTLEPEEVDAYLEHLANQEAAGNVGVFPFPDNIPLEEVDGDRKD